MFLMQYFGEPEGLNLFLMQYFGEPEGLNLFLMQYFGEPEGQVKIQMMSKNLERYYTLKCLIRDLLSNVFVSPKF